MSAIDYLLVASTVGLVGFTLHRLWHGFLLFLLISVLVGWTRIPFAKFYEGARRRSLSPVTPKKIGGR
jgi:hypothetical protein